MRSFLHYMYGELEFNLKEAFQKNRGSLMVVETQSVLNTVLFSSTNFHIKTNFKTVSEWHLQIGIEMIHFNLNALVPDVH